MEPKVIEQKIEVPKVNEEEILVVKVGTDERPASAEDIMDIQKLLAQAATDKSLCIVTHHAISFYVIKAALLKNIITCSDIKEIP